MSVAPPVSSPFAQQAQRPAQTPRLDERAGRAEPFVLPARDAPRPDRERPARAASEPRPRPQPVQRDRSDRTEAADTAARRENTRDGDRPGETGTENARNARAADASATQKDAARNGNEQPSAAEAAADKDVVEDSGTGPGPSADLVLKAEPDTFQVISQAVDPAQHAGNDAVSAADAGQRGGDAAAATLAVASPADANQAASNLAASSLAASSLATSSLATIVNNPLGDASSGSEAALSQETGAASGAVSGAGSVSTQATMAAAPAGAETGDALPGLQGGIPGSSMQAQPKAAADSAKTDAASSGGNRDGLKQLAPAQTDGSGSAGKTVDAARDAANSAAKTEMMSLFEQGTGGMPQLQAKPGDVPSLKTDLLPPPEAPLPQGAKAIPPSAVPVEIGLRTLQGLREFQIRLDPAELGRVDVRLEINDDKSVSARVVVDRVETLHLLQRDAKTLERAFEQAGLKSSDSGIDITLRDPGQHARQERGEAWAGEGQVSGRRNAAAVIVEPTIIPVRRTLHLGALDRSI